MMGIDSEGMLISAVHHENGEEKLHLLMVDPHIPAGAKLYWLTYAESANEFDDFIAKCKELSFYDTGVTAEYGDRLYSETKICKG